MKNANSLCVAGFALAMLGLSVGLIEVAAKPAAKSVNDYFPVNVGGKELKLQLAITPLEQQKGLMYRKSMKPEQGMLFVFGQPQGMSFFMRNTSIPLQIGYLDRDGVLREVYSMHPFDETPVASRSQELQFALEVNQGWFTENQIKVGARLDMKAVRAAIEARGFSPEDLGLRK